ncbi:SgcJ/EcaC family oxidoreductase [Nocardia nova]|uniref:SgcJ/EcaC family oxidoreductase n=1 Tax=Nocardia nova TaxID=37330 RepID=UPI003409DDD5
MPTTTVINETAAFFDTTDVERVVAQLITGWNSHDPIAFAAPFADDAEFVPWFGALTVGAENIEATHRFAFTVGIHKTSVKKTLENRIRVLGPDVVSVRTLSLLTGIEEEHGLLHREMRERWIIVMQRLSGTWKIVEAQNTYEVDWPGAPPAFDRP